MQEQKTIKDFSEIELKSFAYDTLIQIEKLQRDYKILAQEIVNRQQPESNPELEQVVEDIPVEPEPTDEEPKNEK